MKQHTPIFRALCTCQPRGLHRPQNSTCRFRQRMTLQTQPGGRHGPDRVTNESDIEQSTKQSHRNTEIKRHRDTRERHGSGKRRGVQKRRTKAWEVEGSLKPRTRLCFAAKGERETERDRERQRETEKETRGGRGAIRPLQVEAVRFAARTNLFTCFRAN